MPLSDLDCANLCAACYNATEIFDRVIDIAGVWAGVKHYEDCSAVAFRGSTTINDWLHDFQGNLYSDAALGGVEEGFLLGIRDAKAHLDLVIPFGKPLYITGHSLGAAHALIFAAFWQLSQRVTVAVVTFGSPRPGTDQLKRILAPVGIRSYKNGNDPVTGVPLSLFGIPYCHPRDLIDVDVPPPSDDPWGMLARHHIQFYQEAMKNLCAIS